MNNRSYIKIIFLAIITASFFVVASNASAATWPIPPGNLYDEQNYIPRWDIRYNYFDMATISDSLPLNEVIEDGRLHIPDNDPTITSMGDWRNMGQYWTSAQLTIPPNVNGDNARLEARIKAPLSEGAVEARDPILEFSGINGKSAFVFWMADAWGGVWAKYAAGDTMTDNIPEFVKNFDDWHTVALETKNGKVTTFYDGQEVKSMNYSGSIDLLYSLRLGFKGRGSIDWVKLYEGDTLKLTEDFDIDGNTNVQFVNKEIPPSGYSSVMFLPGLEGSRLYKTDPSYGENRLWEPDKGSRDIIKLYLDPDNGKSLDPEIYTDDIIDEAYGWKSIYKKFSASMDQLVSDNLIKEWKPIPYDWRMSLEDIVNDSVELKNNSHMDIIDEIENMAAASKTGKITIIGHSNGGLLAKVLINRLKERGEAGLVDRLIMVGTPQIGTPSSIAGLLHGDKANISFITSKEVSRNLGENMISTYNLLPSEEYFSDVQSPVVEFDEDVKNIYDFQSLYGDKIDNWEEFKKFLLGDDGRRSEPEASDLDSPNVLKDNFLDRAEETHDSLDTWQAPDSIEVIQIAGWGLDTIRGIRYDDCDIPFCPDKLSNLDRSLIIVEDGDGTVVVPSAVEMGGGAERYYLDLKLYNSFGKFQVNRNHSSILETEPLEDFIRNIITGNKMLTEYITKDKPQIESEDKRLRFRLHSPVSIDIYDEKGNHTGLIKKIDYSSDLQLYEEQIPNSYYWEVGEKKYVGSGSDTNIILTGEDLGTFTFDVDEVVGDKVAGTTTFSNVPVMKGMKATLSVSDTVSGMKIDVDNDGEEDTVIQAGEEMKKEELLGIFEKIITSLNIDKTIGDRLANKIDNAKKQMEKGHGTAANAMMENVKQQIEVFSREQTPEKLRIPENEAEKLIGIIGRIQMME